MPKKLPIPSADDLRLAALWCENYESSDEDGDESDLQPFRRVAAWLEQQADAKEMRDCAKDAGVKVNRLRKALARATQGAATSKPL